ncbi:MAG: histidine kinase [Zetaproteobacteria bacterium CG06_land_8_20_14_3_00_59_53]|nr:MAG: histidine kinase [Zetaproteobacteria bacterium CG23_combo_of_CG06-09_8_20_14_all_59_86]PIQ66153.1 MAG: histidine kinase [Zetaproteobacteria bacterium CG11_big_fil_rev_8_21_14_0_20_59_439]PIU71527.1 MAG: histidine kinase [Zetaproteobacteria bacterium CG06_land_8_20_14_3_00_59_53]PIU97787.1 MAG: histidine kinase [Zetaproteobacteria bacterium CG03_land_8_20_14_0_80_59_51]PIY47353.1 MAG: histidine kinase [Zetaproteobacteria bacterium CG_4_10_14_0_8_um_filter_59_127]PJC16561.1 MAG: histidin
MPSLKSVSDLLTDAPTLSRNLQRLLQMRSILILCQFALVALSQFVSEIHVGLWPLLTVIMVYSVVNLLCIRLCGHKSEISEKAYFTQLMLDVVFLTVLMYFSGGYTNPFISLYLFPMMIAATTLPRFYAWLTGASVLFSYTLLVFFYQPIFDTHMGHVGSGFELHLVGMWLTFALSIGLIVFFVMRMSDALRERERRLAVMREKAARDEHIIALGTQAAGAAHEVGTPLATMAVLIGELQHEWAEQKPLVLKLGIIRSQIDRCKETMAKMSASAGEFKAESGRSIDLREYCEGFFSDWNSLHPGANLREKIQGCDPAPVIVVDETLTQSIFNVLNNAYEVSPQQVDASVVWSQDMLEIEVCDHGPGLSETALQSAGKPFFTTKESGHGLGLFLTQAVMHRLGGEVLFSNHADGGACVKIVLPLIKLTVRT